LTPLVVIPGNPGSALFYADFVRRLESLGHEVLLDGHPSLPDAASLLPYAEHHARMVRARLAPGTEVVLVGHSVGAYLAHLIVAHGLLPVARVFMLFPFLRRPGPSGRLILAGLGARAVAALRRLPPPLRRVVVARSAGPHWRTVLAALESEEAPGWAAMARVEREEIATRTSAGYLFEHALFRAADRFVPMLCDGDRWAPPALARELGGLAYRFARPVSHAFVLEPGQCATVVETLHRFLGGEDLRRSPSALP
jgi:alpha-beta hydrolase superfamily lysophospholipase